VVAVKVAVEDADMNKIDLIIDALELAWKENNNEKFYDKYIHAIAAARELRALQPVGVFEYDEESKVWEELTPNCESVKLYALDEVTK
jgi:hypothetical protein